MPSNYKQKQQEMTELNSDGNQSRGRYGEDYDNQRPWVDEDRFLSKEEKRKKQQAQDPRHNQL